MPAKGKRLQRYAPSQVPDKLDSNFLVWLARELRAISAVQDNATWENIENVPPVGGKFPFFSASAVYMPISLTMDSELPFFLANGNPSNIKVVLE